MARYRMTMMHGHRESEGIHDFDEADDQFAQSPMTVPRRSMDAVETREGVGHVDFEANAALKNDSSGPVVTALGNLTFHGNGRQPFVAFISARRD
jgi:hypothetical protein